MSAINRLVASINGTSFTIQKDSIIQDLPNLGLKMNTYLTVVLDGNNLKKYVTYGVSVTKKDSVFEEMITSSTFYFDDNKLIKVEEFAKQADKELSIEWYYDNNKPLFWTSQNELAAARAEFLLTLSKELLKKVTTGN